MDDEFYDWIYENKDKINMDLLNDQFHMNDLIKQIRNIISIPFTMWCNHYSSIGDLRLLKYAHKKGDSMNDRTCFEAAYNGHLECLKYAHDYTS